MKQCNWCEDVDHQQQSTAASDLPRNAKKVDGSSPSSSPIKGESKHSTGGKCPHHHHLHHPPAIDTVNLLPPRTGPTVVVAATTAAGGVVADQKIKLAAAGAIPAAPSGGGGSVAAGAAVVNPTGVGAAGPVPGAGVDSLTAFNLLPAHFRDMFLAAHLLRGKF